MALGGAALLASGGALARDLNSGSSLAGLDWPVSAYDWSDAPGGPRQSLLEQGAADLGTYCGAEREFHVWNMAGEEDPEQFRASIVHSIENAGWVLTEPVKVEPAVYLAARADRQLVVWLNDIPDEFALALFACTPQKDPVSPAALVAAQAAAQPAAASGRLPVVGEMGLGALALGCFFLLGGLWQRRRANAAASWPEVPAQVLVSQVKKTEHMGDSPGERELVFTPEVRYQYCWNGVDYEGKRVQFGSISTAEQHLADAVVAQYPQGTTITARVNPERPSESTLIVTPQGFAKFVAPAIVFAIAGIVLIVTAYAYAG